MLKTQKLLNDQPLLQDMQKPDNQVLEHEYMNPVQKCGKTLLDTMLHDFI